MEGKFDERGFLNELVIQKENIIFPWGIETADSAGFFSLDHQKKRTNTLSQKIHVAKNSLHGEFHVKLPYSNWKLEIDEKIQENTLTRKNTLTCLEPSQFNDFVSRFRFKKKCIHSVRIDGKVLIHKDTRQKYQFPVNQIELFLVSGGKITITLISYKTIDSLEPVFYVRDIKDEWVIHARLFPVHPKIKQIKFNRSFYDKAIPQTISDFLLSIKPIKQYLWYRGAEKRFSPFNAMGLVLGKKGDVLELVTKFTYNPE